jgi:hypothetical protein
MNLGPAGVFVRVIACLVLAGCARQGRAPVASPDGSMTLHTRVEQSQKDRGAYLCIVFEIRDASGRVLHSENTRASDVMRWDMFWITNDRIGLKSSDIGTFYWQRQADGSWKKEGG